MLYKRGGVKGGKNPCHVAARTKLDKSSLLLFLSIHRYYFSSELRNWAHPRLFV